MLQGKSYLRTRNLCIFVSEIYGQLSLVHGTLYYYTSLFKLGNTKSLNFYCLLLFSVIEECGKSSFLIMLCCFIALIHLPKYTIRCKSHDVPKFLAIIFLRKLVANALNSMLMLPA